MKMYLVKFSKNFSVFSICCKTYNQFASEDKRISILFILYIVFITKKNIIIMSTYDLQNWKEKLIKELSIIMLFKSWNKNKLLNKAILLNLPVKFYDLISF